MLHFVQHDSKRIQHTTNPLCITANQFYTTKNPLNTSANQFNTTTNQFSITTNPLNTAANQFRTTKNPLNTAANQFRTTTNPLNTSANQFKTKANPFCPKDRSDVQRIRIAVVRTGVSRALSRRQADCNPRGDLLSSRPVQGMIPV